jgi:hypothetical protein
MMGDVLETQSIRKAGRFDWAAVAAAFIGLSLLWRHLNKGPTQWDDSWYLTDSLALVDALHKWGIGGWVRSYLFEVQERFRAPLMCALPTPIYLVLGRNFRVAILINYLFIIVLFGSVHAIARNFWGRRVALLAVFVTASMTEMFLLTNWYLVEYGLAAIVVAAIWCLIQSEDLTRMRWVIAFSVLCGLGMLQKIIFPVYVGPMLVWCLVRRRKKPGWGKMLAGLIIPGAVICGPWYGANLKIAINHAYFSAYSKQEADLYSTGDPYTWPAMRKYLFMVINEGIGAAYFCISIAAAAVWIVARLITRKGGIQMGKKGAMMLGLWGLPFVVFFFGHNKQVRFIAPVLPVLAIGLAIGLGQIVDMMGKWGWGVVAALLLMAVGFLIQLFFQPLGARVLSFGVDGDHPFDDKAGLHFFDPGMDLTRMYEPRHWPLREMLESVIALSPGAGDAEHPYRIMTCNDSIHYNFNNLQLTALQAELPIAISTTAYYDDPAMLRTDIRTMDFVLMRNGAEAPDPKYNKLQGFALGEVKNDGMFGAVASHIDFPDGGTLVIYRNLRGSR